MDFRDAEKIFRGFAPLPKVPAWPNGERRLLSRGLLEDQVVLTAHTERGEDIRIISIRKAE